MKIFFQSRFERILKPYSTILNLPCWRIWLEIECLHDKFELMLFRSLTAASIAVKANSFAIASNWNFPFYFSDLLVIQILSLSVNISTWLLVKKNVRCSDYACGPIVRKWKRKRSRRTCRKCVIVTWWKSIFKFGEKYSIFTMVFN